MSASAFRPSLLALVALLACTRRDAPAPTAAPVEAAVPVPAASASAPPHAPGGLLPADDVYPGASTELVFDGGQLRLFLLRVGDEQQSVRVVEVGPRGVTEIQRMAAGEGRMFGLFARPDGAVAIKATRYMGGHRSTISALHLIPQQGAMMAFASFDADNPDEGLPWWTPAPVRARQAEDAVHADRAAEARYARTVGSEQPPVEAVLEDHSVDDLPGPRFPDDVVEVKLPSGQTASLWTADLPGDDGPGVQVLVVQRGTRRSVLYVDDRRISTEQISLVKRLENGDLELLTSQSSETENFDLWQRFGWDARRDAFVKKGDPVEATSKI